MMDNVFARFIIGWFNDYKRISGIVLALVTMLLPKIRAAGVPIPEGVEQSIGPWIAELVILALSKMDVRIPVKPSALPVK